MEKFDEVSGIRFRYIEAGSSGDPAVLVHGFNFDSNAWVNAGVVGPVSVDRINLDNIKVPVLGIWGEHDTVSNPSNKELLGKKFRVITISGAGHPAYLDKPREFISAIADFLLNC